MNPRPSVLTYVTEGCSSQDSKNMKNLHMSRRQYIISAGLMTIPFKLSVLPKFLSLYLKKDALIAICLLMVFETVITLLIYAVSEKGGLKNNMRGARLKIISALIAAFLCIKFTLACTEFFYYCSSSLFEGANRQVFLLTILPVAFFIGKGKDRSLGRVAQTIIPVIYIALILNVAFSTTEPVKDNLFPLFNVPFEKTALFSLRYLFYTGDALPLIFVGIKESEKDLKHAFAYVRICLQGLTVVLFYVAFYSVYGDSLTFINNVFNRLASFNALTRDLNGLEMLAIISWTFSAVFALGGYAHALITVSETIFKRKKLAYTAYFAFFILLTTLNFIMTNNLTHFETLFMQSGFAYLGALSVIIAIIIFTIAFVNKKTKPMPA